jgi:hypothetical protein
VTLGTLAYASPQGPPSLEHNRRNWLIVFGVFSILLGTASGLIALFVSAFLIQEAGLRKPVAPVSELVLAAGTYAFFAFGFIALGVGSVRCRRWVRPVVLAFGAVIIAGSLLKFTAIAAAAWKNAINPTARIGNTNYGAVVFALLIFLALIYVAFYSKDTVRQTLQAYDVKSSWCEQCPLPVLVAAAGLFVAGTGVVLLSTDSRAPFGGASLNGAPAVLIKLIYGIIILFSAYRIYSMKSAGWWIAIVTLIAGFAANLISRFTEGTISVQAVQGVIGPAFATPQLPTPTFTVALTGVVCVGYLLTIHRYFRRPLPVFQ